MNRIATFLALGCATVFLIVLAACGGGGGGDGSTPFVPVAYTGVSTQAIIDGTNAVDYAALAEAGTTFGMLAPVLVSAGAQRGTTIPAVQTLIDFGQRLPDYLPTLKGGAANLAAVSQSDTYDCGLPGGTDGTAFVVETWAGTPNTSDGVLTSDITFKNCDEGGGVVFNGRVSLVLTGITVDTAGAPDLLATTQFDMSQTYWNLQAYFQPPVDETITFYTVMNFSFDDSGLNSMVSMTIPTMVMLQASTGFTAQVKNYSVSVVSYTGPPAYDEIDVASAALKAQVYDQDLGYVEIYTLPGSPILEDLLTGPYAGIVRMEGANGSRAEVDFSLACDNGTYFDGTVGGTFCYIPIP